MKAGAIHGDLRQSQRERALKDFTDGKLPVLVATDVAARGLHIEAIDVVDPLRPARGPQDLPAPLGPHGAGRRGRRRRHPRAVGPAPGRREAAEAPRHPQPIVEVFSNDPRLADLAAWDPRRRERAAVRAVRGGADHAVAPRGRRLLGRRLRGLRRAHGRLEVSTGRSRPTTCWPT